MNLSSMAFSRRGCGMHQRGFTLAQLMVSSALGMIVVLVATMLLLSTRTMYLVQEDLSRVQEGGRFAQEIIGRAVRQAGYEDWNGDRAAVLSTATMSASIAGLDAHSLRATEPGLDNPVAAVNGSDVLAVRYSGSGTGDNGDGTVLNCGGFGVAAPTSQARAEIERGWSIFYVAKDASDEPELRCKYAGRNSWASDAVVSGVESFQVLYGIDSDGDGAANRYVNATAVEALDRALVLEGANPAARSLDLNRKTHWKKVVSLKIALLVRGSQPLQDTAPSTYDLFGSDYAAAGGAGDAGTTIDEARLPRAKRLRLRKVFSTTVPLRNAAAGSAV